MDTRRGRTAAVATAQQKQHQQHSSSTHIRRTTMYQYINKNIKVLASRDTLLLTSLLGFVSYLAAVAGMHAYVFLLLLLKISRGNLTYPWLTCHHVQRLSIPGGKQPLRTSMGTASTRTRRPGTLSSIRVAPPLSQVRRR